MQESIKQQRTKNRELVIIGTILSILELISAFGIYYSHSTDMNIMNTETFPFVVWLISSILLYPSFFLWIFGLIVGAVLLLRKRWISGSVAILGALVLLIFLLYYFRHLIF